MIHGLHGTETISPKLLTSLIEQPLPLFSIRPSQSHARPNSHDSPEIEPLNEGINRELEILLALLVALGIWPESESSSTGACWKLMSEIGEGN